MSRFAFAAGLAALCLLPRLGQATDSSEEKGTASPSKPESILFEPLPMVEAASLHAQTLLEAPASVTVITDEDIRRRGYRTLAEALADARGLYVSYDRAYQFVGVRGFSLPGDYNTRFLVMVNGHSLTENVYGSAGYFGEDFGLDMELIKRIEIIRGPSSALYGSNGMFATVNIVTKSPVDYESARVSTEIGSFGSKKAHYSTSQYLGRGANLLLSVSLFNNSGQSLYSPRFDSAQTNYGWAENVDGERGYHSFANLIWRGWSFLAYFNDREKLVPTGWYGTLFNGRGTKVLDGRGFLESAYQRNVGAEGKLQWRVYYDQYRYTGRYDELEGDGGTDDRDGAKGDWVGTQLTYRFRVPRVGFLTIGSEASWDLRAVQLYSEIFPIYDEMLHIDRRDRSFGVFFQQEWVLSPKWKAYLGGRLDESRFRPRSLTPRIALIYQPSDATALKFLYGRAFRNPNSFEQFYDDSGVSQIPNPTLRPERMQTLEVVFERQLSKKFEALANVYHYRLDDLITAVPVIDPIQQFRNLAFARKTGFELGAVAQFRPGLKLDANLAVEGASHISSRSHEVNAPSRVGKLLFEMPLAKDWLSLSSGLQYLSPRETTSGDQVPAVYLVNLTVASRRLPGGLEFQCGARNLFNRRYWDPVGIEHGVDRLLEDGRNFFIRLSWSSQPPRHEETQHRLGREP